MRWTRRALRAAAVKPARVLRISGAPRINLLIIVSQLSHIRNLAAFDLPSVPAQITEAMHAKTKSAAVQPRWRANLRLALGQAQVIGATITLAFLLQGGVSAPAIWGVILTGVVSLVSILLFRLIWREKPKG